MKTLLPLLLLVGCANLPADNKPCAERAAAFADRTTPAGPSPTYQMDWIGRYQDEYARCAR